MGRLVLTGIGMVTPIGIGREEIMNAASKGRSGISKLTKFSSLKDIYCGEIDNPGPDGFINDKRFRRAAPISQYALAAAALAMSEAGIKKGGNDTALVMGITHGALGYTQEFHRTLIQEGADAISPIHFSDSVLNAPAGNVSICFGIKGPVHTLIGGPEAAIKSMMTACRMLAGGAAERAVVVSSEELNELSLSSYTRLGYSFLSEGAGAVMIEQEETVKGTSPYCAIAGMASECNPSGADAALENSIMRCLDIADLLTSDIDLVMADEKVAVNQFMRSVPAGSIIPLAGNAFAVSVIWDILLSAMALKNGAMPHTIIRNGAAVPVRLNNVMICTADLKGSAAAIILSKCI